MSFYTQTPPPLFSNEPPPIDANDDDDDFDDFQVASSDSMKYNSFPDKSQIHNFPINSSSSNDVNSLHVSPPPPHNHVEMNHISLATPDSPISTPVNHETMEQGPNEVGISKPPLMDAPEFSVQYTIPSLQPPLFNDNGELSSGSPSDVDSECDDRDDDHNAMEYETEDNSFQPSDSVDGPSSQQINVLNPLQLGEYVSHVAENCQSSNDHPVVKIPTSTPSGTQLLHRSMDETRSSLGDNVSVDEFGDFSTVECETNFSSTPQHDTNTQVPPILSNDDVLHESSSPPENLREEAHEDKQVMDELKSSILEDDNDDFGEFADFNNMSVTTAQSSQEELHNQDQLNEATNMSEKPSPNISDVHLSPTSSAIVDNEDEFGEFGDFETKAPVTNDSQSKEATDSHQQEDNDSDEFEDFANFQEASMVRSNESKSVFTESQPSIKTGASISSTESSGSTLLERLAEKIEPLMATCFKCEVRSQLKSPETNRSRYCTALGEAEDRLKDNMEQRCKELLSYLEDFEISRSVKYQWNDSHSYRDFLHLNRIDYESLMKSRQPALPAFACHMATTGGGILEPQKVLGLSSVMKPTSINVASLENGSSSGRASPRIGASTLTRSNGSGTSLDVAEFDWSASGLVNPLQSGLDTELLSAADTTGLSQCFQSGIEPNQSAISPTSTSITMTKSISSGNLKSTASNVLQRFLVKPPSASASQNSLQRAQILTASNLQQQTTGKNLDELSEPARDIVLRLPRIASYMNAKVLMFPLLSDRKSSIDSSVNN